MKLKYIYICTHVLIYYTTEELVSKCVLMDYDKIDDLDTRAFTRDLDTIEILTLQHPFIQYLTGFLHGIFHNHTKTYQKPP